MWCSALRWCRASAAMARPPRPRSRSYSKPYCCSGSCGSGSACTCWRSASARSRRVLLARAWTLFPYLLNKMRTRGSRIKPVGEILRFMGHQSFAEFHDTHRVRWYAVIAKYEFRDPEIAAADNSTDRITLPVRLDEPALLNVMPAADPLARLRIIKHGILAIDFMFDREVVRIRRIPVALQQRPHGSIIHLQLPSTVPAVMSRPPRQEG